LLRGEGFHAETFYAENFRYGAVTRAEFVHGLASSAMVFNYD